MANLINVDRDLVERYIRELAQFGGYGETGVWRTVYTPEWLAAQDQVADWLAEAGLAVRRDAVGNVWGTLVGGEAGPSIATGSHIDSQTPGGRFDGALGVIAAVVAVRALKEQFGTPRLAVEAVSLCEEEASRFQEAAFWGTRAITHAIEGDEPDAIVGYDGVTIAQAMRDVGLDPARIREAGRDDIDTFIELHIEQGPILEEADLPVGIVAAITGQRRYVVELVGRSDHAGARPMHTRRDPMLGAAEIAVDVIKTAIEMGWPAVTTVGRVLVEPNLPSAVPEKVTFSIDVRHPDEATLQKMFARYEDVIRSIAERRHLDYSWEDFLSFRPTICDPGLVAALERAASQQGVASTVLHSGAGHDSQQMAKIAKVAMVFVRSQGGRSHTPEELTTVEDAVEGIRVLAAALHDLAY